MPMNPEIKTKWLLALRSGAYIQGKDYLEQDQMYCCLGVLCAVQGEEPRERFPTENDRMTAILPEDLAAGLDQEEMDKLANMNDDGESFQQIAEYIEQYF